MRPLRYYKRVQNSKTKQSVVDNTVHRCSGQGWRYLGSVGRGSSGNMKLRSSDVFVLDNELFVGCSFVILVQHCPASTCRQSKVSNCKMLGSRKCYATTMTNQFNIAVTHRIIATHGTASLNSRHLRTISVLVLMTCHHFLLRPQTRTLLRSMRRRRPAYKTEDALHQFEE